MQLAVHTYCPHVKISIYVYTHDEKFICNFWKKVYKKQGTYFKIQNITYS
jgi:hypothetical protein